MSTLDCRRDLRRADVRRHELNGLDYLEVSDLVWKELSPSEQEEYDSPKTTDPDRLLSRRKLTVFFVNKLQRAQLIAMGVSDTLNPDNTRDVTNLVIEGGERKETRAIEVKLRIGDPIQTAQLTLHDRSTLIRTLRERVCELLTDSVPEPQKTR